MGICPNCGSWVDDGDICMNCGGYDVYDSDDEYQESKESNYDYTQDRDKYSDKAWKYYNEYKSEEALAYIDRALDLDKNNGKNWNRKGIILEDLKRYPEAEKCYNRSLELEKSDVVFDNKARMFYVWAKNLLDESKELPNGLDKLDEAEDKIIKAIKALSGDSDEDILKYLYLRDSIVYYIDNEKKFQRKLETLKKYKKSELFTLTGVQTDKIKAKLHEGLPLKLVKEPDNKFDKDAIAVYAENEKIGYVANNDYTKCKLTSSASELQEKLGNTTQASYLLFISRYADINFLIGRLN